MSSEISNKPTTDGAQVIAFKANSGAVSVRDASPVSASRTDETEKDKGTGGVSREQLQEAVSKMNDQMQDLRRSLQFSIDEDSGRTVVKVVEAETKEVIRQIPSEELLALSKRLEENVGRIIQAEA